MPATDRRGEGFPVYLSRHEPSPAWLLARRLALVVALILAVTVLAYLARAGYRDSVGHPVSDHPRRHYG